MVPRHVLGGGQWLASIDLGVEPDRRLHRLLQLLLPRLLLPRLLLTLLRFFLLPPLQLSPANHVARVRREWRSRWPLTLVPQAAALPSKATLPRAWARRSPRPPPRQLAPSRRPTAGASVPVGQSASRVLPPLVSSLSSVPLGLRSSQALHHGCDAGPQRALSRRSDVRAKASNAAVGLASALQQRAPREQPLALRWGSTCAHQTLGQPLGKVTLGVVVVVVWLLCGGCVVVVWWACN